MKKSRNFIAVILSVLLILCCCPVSLAADSPLKVLIATDIHVKSTELIGDLSQTDGYSETDPYFDATIQGQMSNVSEGINRRFFNEFLESDEEILLIAGDLTSSAKPVDHSCVRDMMQQTLDEAQSRGLNKKIYVINGNHDIDDDEGKFTTADEFKQCYSAFGYSDAVAVDESSCSYAADLNENYRLIAVDTCIYGEDNGEITSSDMEWIKAQISSAKADGKYPVVMCHHSVVKHFNVQSTVKCSGGAGKALADMGVRYVFTGHIHANDISALTTKKGNRIYDIMTGSLITSPCSYRAVSFSEQSVDIEMRYLDGLDENYLPYGISDVQRELVVNNFNEYKEGFLSAGIQYWVAKNLCSPAFVARKLKIQTGTPAYEAADYLMTECVGAALTVPLYENENTPGKNDSFEELAASCGYTLPESDYEYVNEAIADVVATFFAGDENIKYTDKEIQIVLSVLSTGLTYAVVKLLTGGERSDKAQALFNVIGVCTDKISGTFAEKILIGRNAADIIIGAAVIPVLEGITNDEYAPSDLNVSLEGTAAELSSLENEAPSGLFALIISYFRSFIRILTELIK
ncbi:MAG: metallophosphoesterase [Clostridia bacterium]|nr:metallophosphoesterase [Clostridia bacterium]